MHEKRPLALIIGGSMAGMLAAQALTQRGYRAHILERDVESSYDHPRPGAPQGRQLHLLLGGGADAIERLMPGFGERRARRGCVAFDFGTGVCWRHYGVRKVDAHLDLPLFAGTRPHLEGIVREMLGENPAVRFEPGVSVVGMTYDQKRITGLRVLRGDALGETIMEADLVIDASGRNSRAHRWLECLGTRSIPVEEQRLDLGYASVMLELPPDAPIEAPATLTLHYPSRPDSHRNVLVAKVEGGRYQMSAMGYAKDFPPNEEAALRDWVASIGDPQVDALLRHARFAGPIRAHRTPHQLRRRYDRVRIPQGFLPIGDAITSFDPVFGQGMTVAAMQAATLLRGSGRVDTQVAVREFMKVTRVPWMITNIEASRFEHTGPTPAWHRPVHRILDRVFRASGNSVPVYRAFMQFMHLQRGFGAFAKFSVLRDLVRFGGAKPQADALSRSPNVVAYETDPNPSASATMVA